MAGTDRVFENSNPAHENFEFNLALSGQGGNILCLNTADSGNFEGIPLIVQALVTGNHSRATVRNDTLAHQPDFTLYENALDPLEREARRAQRIETQQHRLDVEQRAEVHNRRITNLHNSGFADSTPGTGWENTTDVAIGHAISLAQYGPSTDALRNTCLEETELPAAPPSRPCRADERGIETLEYPTTDTLQRTMSEYLEAREEERADELRGDAKYKEIQEHRKMKQALFAAFLSSLQTWSQSDPVTHSKFRKHLVLAHQSSTSNARIWQVMSWFTRDVPGDVSIALNQMVKYHIDDSELELDLKMIEYYLEAATWWETNDEQMQDDDGWQYSNTCKFGFEEECCAKSINSYSDYVPRGTGAIMAKHCLASFATRKLRWEHASGDEKKRIGDSFLKFVTKAEKVLSKHLALLEAQPRSEAHSLADVSFVKSAQKMMADFIKKGAKTKRAAEEAETGEGRDQKRRRTERD